MRALSAPAVAWPSLLLAAAALGAWATGLWLGASGVAPAAAAVALCALAAYVAFTPMHDASHRSLFARARWGNELVGRVVALPLWAPFPMFRYVHLEHHKHTNEDGADPDAWSGGGRRWTLPLRWLTQDLHYVGWYARAGRPRRELVDATLSFGAMLALAGGLLAAGYGREVLLFWVLPSRLAVGVLAFAFDWLPHRPHRVSAREDRLRATSATEGRLWYVLSLGQSLHLVHHLYPGVPFYRYATLWRERVRELVASRQRAPAAPVDIEAPPA